MLCSLNGYLILRYNIIKQAKCDYFNNKIDVVKKDPKQTWKFINELSSRKTSNTASVK